MLPAQPTPAGRRSTTWCSARFLHLTERTPVRKVLRTRDAGFCEECPTRTARLAAGPTATAKLAAAQLRNPTRTAALGQEKTKHRELHGHTSGIAVTLSPALAAGLACGTQETPSNRELSIVVSRHVFSKPRPPTGARTERKGNNHLEQVTIATRERSTIWGDYPISHERVGTDTEQVRT